MSLEQAFPDDKKLAARQRARAWRIANPDKAKESQKRWREANPERNRELQRKWGAENKDRKKQHRKRYSDAHPEARRESWLKGTYGITAVEWQKLFDSQDRKCAVCQSTEPVGGPQWVTDHCHTTSKVRGILCQNCNRALGLMRDDTQILRNAALYIEGTR